MGMRRCDGDGRSIEHGLNGSEINPKFEYRNTKQIRMSKTTMIQTCRSDMLMPAGFEHLNFDIDGLLFMKISPRIYPWVWGDKEITKPFQRFPD